MKFRLIKEMMDSEFTFDTSMMGKEEEPNPAAGIFSKETEDHPDVVSMDVPTLIRIMEWSNEDAQDDVQIHQFANALIQASFSHEHPLNMDDYTVALQSISPIQGSQDEGNDTEVVYTN